jgi:DNA-binding response OmpR family regulator
MPSRRPVLIVDDDADLCAAVVEHLNQSGEFVAEAADSIAQADAKLGGAPSYDAIFLDIGLPDGDGSEFCAKLRRTGIKIPILMLTGSGAEADVVRGLESGANDYIAKPIGAAVLLARLRAQLRLYDGTEDATFVIGPYLFQPAAKRLHDKKKQRRVRLTDKEAGLLKFLHRAKGHGVTRQVLLDQIWGYNANVTTHTLETHIYRLRQKIESDPSSPRLLVTSPGGYGLNLEAAAE